VIEPIQWLLFHMNQVTFIGMKTQAKRFKRFKPASAEVQRKATYRLYPNPEQEADMLDMKGTHMRLYNAFLDQRRLAWKRRRLSIGKSEQSAELRRLRQEDDEIGALSAVVRGAAMPGAVARAGPSSAARLIASAVRSSSGLSGALA
jgi:hypothetical protein